MARRNQGPKGNAGDADPGTPGRQSSPPQVNSGGPNFGGPPSQLQPMPPSGPMLGPSMGLAPVQGGITPDADGRGFTNANGGHDWNVGSGPGGNFGGQVNRTGQSVIGTEALSGDSQGFARGTPQYQQATAARQAWIQSNLSQGRTLADLGLEPTRGGGLANFMALGSTLHPGAASPAPTQPVGTPVNPDGSPRGPVAPGGPAPAMPGAPKPGTNTDFMPPPLAPGAPGGMPSVTPRGPVGAGGPAGINNPLGSLGTGLGGPSTQRERVASPTAGLARTGGAALGGSMGLGGGSLYGGRRLY